MRLDVREVLSLALGLGGIAMMGTAMSHLLDTGTCASGGAHVIARHCPPGSGLWSVLLPAGMLVWLSAFFVSKGGLAQPGAGRIVWTAGFAGGGLALLVKAFTQPSLGPGSPLGIYLMAAIFIPFGVAVWIPTLVGIVRRRRAHPQPAQSVAPDRPEAQPARTRGKQVQRLRRTGR